mgnify:CR=1 FL=1
MGFLRTGGSTMIRQFVCILDNCESFVAWASSREEAVADCTANAGKPVHVWPTGRKFRDTDDGAGR